MNELENVLLNAKNISNEIGRLLKLSTYQDYDDLSGLKIDYCDSEQLFLLDELRSVMDKLDSAKCTIDYLQRPIIYTGTLHKNTRDRYEINNKEFTSGNTIEALITDNYHNAPYWIHTRVEHNGKDYYLIGSKDTPMKGLKVRVRG